MERKEEKEKEKVKAHRKRSGEHQPLHSTRRETLPTPPPDPTVAAAAATAAVAAPSGPAVEGDAYACTGSYAETDPFKRLFTYREREAQFLRLLCEGDPATAVQDGGDVGCKKPPGPCHSQSLPGSNAKEPDTPDAPTLGRNEPGFESANEFLMLLNRAGPSVAAALSTKDAIDQLDRLHELIGQMLTLQEQNMRMHWQLKNVETLRKLKLMQLAMAKDPEAFLVGLPEDTSDNDLLDSEIGPNLALLETILAAGNSASSKRSSSKRERSKSVINDEIGNFQLHRKESGGGGGGGGGCSGRNYPLRRQSAISDFKPKVSKWTKVKAAFKWEKTSALPANEIKSTEAMMIPVNNEVARYLRVPSIPCVGSSGDSVFSSSSGIVVSGGSAPGTPGENSLASSAENLTDLNEEVGAATTQRERHGKRDSVKSTERSSQEEDARRSRSLDGEAILEPIRQMDKNKNKSAWSKVKGIVKNHRGSLKSNESRRDAKPSNSVGCSREASPCESMDACEMMQRDRSDSFSSSQTSPGHRSSAMTPTFLLLPAASPGSVAAAGGGDTSAPSGPNSPCSSIPGTQGTFSSGEDGEWRPAPEGRTTRSGSGDRGVPTATLVTPGTGRGSRKSKHIPEIESVPEGVPVETRSPSNSQHTSMTSHNTTNTTTTTNSSSSSSSISKLRKSPPKPLSLHRQPDSIDVLSTDPAAQSDAAVAQLGAASSPGPKYSPKRKSYAGICLDPDGGGSLPGSPSGKQFSFFAGPADRMVAELIEPDYSSGDVSDQNTPKRRPSPKYHHRTLQRQREEIERRYQELQQKLQHEFDAKQQEWERMRPAAVMLNNSPLNQLLKEEAAGAAGMHGAKAQPPPIVEDNLTPDFKKKLNEWRTKHQPGVDAKKKPITDWQLWKTGQIKLEGQGLKQLPDAKDLPEDFQKKLSEWKQMKAANKVPSYTTQSSQGESGASMKRQQSKASGGAVKKSKTSDELEKERHHHQAAQQQQQQQHHHHHSQQQHQQQYLPKAEGLSKLKALVSTSEAPKKELVVQTTKGFIKFEGISRKFTRKLFEWEKAKGIGPEASTIALLHPGYAPVVVETRGVVLENKREKSPALARSLSMDSIAPIPSASSISHQPSSLSLNDADELKDVDKDSGSNRRVSSNPELELSAEREEPGAVLVEVEDEILEVADPLLMPVLPPEGERRRESTTLGVNQKAKEPGYSSRPSSNSSTILKDSTKLLIRLSEQDSVNRDEVRRLKIVLRALIATLPEFVETGSRDSIAFFAYMKDLALDVLRQLHRFDDGTLRDAGEVLGNVQSINGSVAELKKSLHSYMKYASAQAANGGRSAKDEDIPQISITPAVGAQATSSIQRTDDSFRNMATINVTPTFVCNAVRVNTVELVQPNPSSVVRRFPISSESEPAPLTSQSPDSSAYALPQAAQCKLDSPEKDVREPGAGKKLQRNLSNGSRRKARIKRMGSRQSSKTESDSDDSPQNYVLDVPRKAKRKTSRAKKPSSDSTEKLATAPAGGEKVCEDVVYVLKIKPGQKIEQVERPQPQNASLGMAPGDEVLISPQETCVELMEVGIQPTIQPSVTCTASVLVKTKRKIFTTVDGDNLSAGGVAGQPVAISQELESGSGASDRNDVPETVVNVVLSSPTPQEQRIVTNLPPLPQSPSMQRRMDAAKAPNKELSPNIRLMIAKYNQRLTTEKGGASPHSSGSCSPVAWRSPVLDRRVRKQTEKYQETIQLSKSASAGSLRKSLKQLEEEKERGTDSNRGEFGADRDRTRVLKSFSASKIEGTSKDVIERELTVGSGGTEKEPSPELGTFLACDSLRRRDTLSRLERTREQQQQQQQTVANEPSASIASSPSCQTITSATGTIRKERLYKKRTESPIATGTGTGSIKKSAGRTEKYTRCRSVPNEECAVEVLISSKALKPPSPRLIARRRLNLEQQQHQRTGEFSKSAPTTPLEENRSILVPLSQRALKLKKAKEDFLRAPLGGDRAALGNGCSQEAAEHQPWSNRISQISATSTASSSVVEGELTLLMKSASAGVIGARSVPDHDGTVTLRRNESGSSYVEGEPGPPGASSRHSISTGSTAGVATGSIAAGSGGSRFGGLSNLASKLRKVKLRRSSKDLSKMNAISALCRQSLMVDISGEAAAKMGSAQSLGSPRRAGREDGEQDEGRDGDGAEPLKKSGSVQAICNRFRRSGERSDELKKSRSLGFLEPDRKGSG